MMRLETLRPQKYPVMNLLVPVIYSEWHDISDQIYEQCSN